MNTNYKVNERITQGHRFRHRYNHVFKFQELISQVWKLFSTTLIGWQSTLKMDKHSQ